MTSLADLLASVFDRRKVWPAPATPSEKSIAELAFELVGSAGEASGLASAAAILASYVHILGRNKDLIISGGYNIYPKEIELVLDAQSRVIESAVIGVPHRDLGETAIGLLVAEPGQSLDLEQIMEAIKATLARFKHPRKLILVPELPRNAMAKVRKNILREQFKDAVHAV